MARVTVVPDTIDYPDSDGLPMAETESQFWPILYAGSALDRHYHDRDDVYVVGNLLLYYREGNPREGDFGASKHVRPSYKLWEEPKAPDFVLEIAADGTLAARSNVLGLELRVRPAAPLQEAFRFYDAVRGEPLRSLREAEQGRQEAEWARRETEDRLREEQAARRALEAELRELRLRGG